MNQLKPKNHIDIFPWNEHFNTGIATIDKQHQKLVHLLNTLANHVAFKSNIPELNDIFDQLADYTVFHFQEEEAIWQQYLPHTELSDKHAEEHNRFIRDVVALKKQITTSPNHEIIESLLAYLTKWLVFHILENDRYLANVVLELQAGSGLEDAKKHAFDQLNGSHRTLVELILTVYDKLSTNALELMREISAHRKTEDRYRRLFEVTGTATGIVEADGTFSLVNHTFAQLAETDIDTLVGMQFTQLLAADCVDQVQQYHRARLNGQEAPLTYAIDFITLQGNKGSANLNLAYLTDSQQTIVSIIDMTAVNATKQQLITTAENLKRAQRIAHTGNWTYRVADSHMDWSDALFEIFDRPIDSDSLSYERLLSWIHPEDRKAHDTYLQKILAVTSTSAHELEDFICRLITPSGEVRWVEVVVECEFDTDQYPAFFFGTVQNITQRMLAEIKWRESERQLAFIANHAPFCIAHCDAQKRYKFVNESYAALFGLSVAKMVGMHVKEVMGDEAFADACPYMDSVLSGVSVSYDQPRVSKNNQRCDLSVHYVPEFDHAKQVVGFIAAISDITARKQMQTFEKFRNKVLESLAGDAPLTTVLKQIVLGLESLYPEMMGSISMLDAEGIHLVNAIAPSLPDFYNEAVEGVTIGLGVGSCGTAAFTGQRVVAEDITVHPYWVSYRELTKKAGLQSCWSQPVIAGVERKVMGTVAIYHKKPHTPDHYDIQLIEQAAQLIGIAIDQSDSREQLRIAATAFESQEGIMITDANSVIIKVNKAFTVISGYSAEDAIGQKPSLLSSGYHPASFYHAMWAEINSTGTWVGEVWNKRKNNEIYPENLTITAVKSERGDITHYVGILVDITERKAHEEAINKLAFYDPLTLLPNRRLFMDRLSQALITNARRSHDGALLFFDIDNFKTLNDMHGHAVGDVLLQEMGQRLTPCVREGDTIARLGGDEFVVILEDLSENVDEAAVETEAIAEKILASLSQPYVLGELTYNSSVSIGATLFSSSQGNTSELMKQADMAMYQAKNTGRNTFCFFEPEMQKKLITRTALESELAKALEEVRPGF